MLTRRYTDHNISLRCNGATFSTQTMKEITMIKLGSVSELTKGVTPPNFEAVPLGIQANED